MSKEYDAAYDEGYDDRDEEWEMALRTVLPVSLFEDITPAEVVDYIKKLQEGKMR